MADLPFMPLYVGDYLSDTQHLSAEQSGAYLHLLMVLWTNGGQLDLDHDQLARASRVDAGRWPGTWRAIQGFFSVENNAITQARLMAELEKATAFRSVLVESGKRGAAKRWAIRRASDESESPSTDPRASDDVIEVIAHYRKHHPRSFPKPHSGLKEWKLIAGHLKHGRTVEELCAVIDAYERDPWHQGANDRKTKFNSLALYMRDEEHIRRGLEMAQQSNGHAKPGNPMAAVIAKIKAEEEEKRE